jgi:hypothetical protein
MKKILSIVLIAVLSPHAYGQLFPQHSAGVRVAGGYYGDSHDQGGTRGIVGAEACLFCEGRRAWFLEYSHFFPPGSGVYDNADLVAAGIRLQSRRKAMFFFDIGVAVGNSRLRSTSLSTVGAAFGSGLQITVGPRLYFSPFFRIYPMNHTYIAGSFGTGLGLRF